MTDMATNETGRRSVWRTLLAGCVKLLIAAGLIAGAGAVYQQQMRTKPQAGRAAPAAQARLVQIVPVERQDCVTTVTAMGTVSPAQRVTLRPQVSGQIVELSAEVIPGGIVRAGQRLAAIDPRDYEIAVQQRKGDLARAMEQLKLEQGNQAVARKEYNLLGEIVTDDDLELVLREPQLAAARAAVDAAEAAVRKAELDLSRCEIVAPFNAIVQQKHVDEGATVGTNSDLVTLIGTDEAWIEAMVRVDQLKWLDIPQRNGTKGSPATIHNDAAWGEERVREGRIVRLGGELETQARWARVLVTVTDPFSLEESNAGRPTLLMGTYVRVELAGRPLADVIPVNRSHLRDSDTVWIMDENDQLAIREVKVVFREPDGVYVSEGLQTGDRLVTTNLAAPVPGMPLRAAEDETGTTAAAVSEGGLQ